MKYLKLGLFFYICSIVSAFAATYYVDAVNGNDSNNGLSTATAWKGLAKVQSFSASPGFAPGDNILLRKGQIHQGPLDFQSSGTSASKITIGAYSPIDPPSVPPESTPRLANIGWVPGANISGNWSDQGNNIWRLANVAINPTRLRLSGVEYVAASSIANIDSYYCWYYDDANNYLYVYCVDTNNNSANPATIHTSVNGGISGLGGAKHILSFTNVSYIVVDTIEIVGGYEAGLYIGENGYNITVQGCTIRNGRSGILVDGNGNPDQQRSQATEIKIVGNTIDSGANYIYNYEFDGIRDGIFMHSGVVDSLVDANTILDWGRAGIYLNGHSDGAIERLNVRNNSIEALHVSYCRGILLESSSGGMSNGVAIFDNTINNTKAPSKISASGVKFYGNSISNVTNSPAYLSSSRGTGIGLVLSDSNEFQDFDHNVIMNNTIENCNDVGLSIQSTRTNFSESEYKLEYNYILSNTITNCGTAVQNSEYGEDYHHLINISLEVSEAVTGSVGGNKFFKNVMGTTEQDADVYYKGTPYTVDDFNSQGTAGDKAYGNVTGTN